MNSLEREAIEKETRNERPANLSVCFFTTKKNRLKSNLDYCVNLMIPITGDVLWHDVMKQNVGEREFNLKDKAQYAGFLVGKYGFFISTAYALLK